MHSADTFTAIAEMSFMSNQCVKKCLHYAINPKRAQVPQTVEQLRGTIWHNEKQNA